MIHTIRLCVGSFLFALLVLGMSVSLGVIITIFVYGLTYGEPLFEPKSIACFFFFVGATVYTWWKGNQKNAKY